MQIANNQKILRNSISVCTYHNYLYFKTQRYLLPLVRVYQVLYRTTFFSLSNGLVYCIYDGHESQDSRFLSPNKIIKDNVTAVTQFDQYLLSAKIAEAKIGPINIAVIMNNRYQRTLCIQIFIILIGIIITSNNNNE